MKNFFTTLQQAFLRMDGLERAGATLMLISLVLFVSILFLMGYRVIDGRIKAAQYNRAFAKPTNRFKPDPDKENAKDAIKSLALLVFIVVSALIAAKGF